MDTITLAAPTGDPGQYVHSVTQEITASVAWHSEFFNGTPFPWSIYVDEIVFVITE